MGTWKRFPQVLAVGSFIYGLPGDTPASVRAIHQLAVELELDQFFFIPLTPLPGAAGWGSERGTRPASGSANSTSCPPAGRMAATPNWSAHSYGRC